MELVFGILLLPLGFYLINLGIKEIKKESESGWPGNSINFMLFACALVMFSVILMYNYFKS